MKAQLGSILLLFCLARTALALEGPTFVPRIEFECGGAAVVIDSQPKGFRSPEEAFVKTGQDVHALITVSRGNATAIFQGWRNIDYIGGICVQDAQGRPRIVFRAFCGGSACNDRRWGIIDPIEPRELLAPADLNTERARELLGLEPTPYHQLVSLLSGE